LAWKRNRYWKLQWSTREPGYYNRKAKFILQNEKIPGISDPGLTFKRSFRVRYAQNTYKMRKAK